jgi:hypothetical protein
MIVLLLLVIVGVAAFLLLSRRGQQPGSATTAGNSVLSGQIAKPKPIANTFKGCPPSGDGGDPVLNTLKNRIDEAQWQPTTISDLLALRWPPSIENRPRSRWTLQDREQVALYEGTPVQVEGYLVEAKKMSPETCNCHSVAYVDYHVWMVDELSKGRDQSLVLEVSPRVQVFHPQWTLDQIRRLARSKERVRISGWLLMDPEHPDQIGKTRGTIWEIHPIMQIETRILGGWTPLDDGTTGVSSSPAAAQTVPPITPADTATQPPRSNAQTQNNKSVQITDIFFDGKKGSAEPDEYVELKNSGDQPVDMTDWELQDPSGSNEFKWESFVLRPGATIRVYTNEVHPESGGFSFSATRAIWANSGDVAELYDADKLLVSRYAYGKSK